MGDDGLLVVRWAGGREGLVELAEAESGDDGVDVGVVREVHVDGLVKGEGGVVGVESHVGLGLAGREVVEMLLEAGVLGEWLVERVVGDGVEGLAYDFLDVADTNGTTNGRTEAVVAVELEVDGVFESLPFLEGEEVAPGGIAESYSLIGAESLSLGCVSTYCLLRGLLEQD